MDSVWLIDVSRFFSEDNSDAIGIYIDPERLSQMVSSTSPTDAKGVLR